MRRVIVLVVLLLLVTAGWFFRDSIRDKWNAMRGNTEAPQVASEELAAAADVKLQALKAGETERVALSTMELQSLLQYKYAGVLPAFAQEPKIELKGDELRLQVRVPIDRLPKLTGLGDAASFLPDTAEVALTGTLIPLTGSRVALGVNEVQAARIPLPDRMVAEALSRVGRVDEPGLPKDAIAVKLPAGVTSAYVRADSLILLANKGN